MNRIHTLHSPATHAFDGVDMRLQLAVPDEGNVAAPTLSYCVTRADGSEQRTELLPMQPHDGIATNEQFSLYTAKIPAAALVGATALSYFFTRNGAESDTYEMPVLARPVMPPLMLTELLTRTRNQTQYAKLANLTDGEIDLYDFELLAVVDGCEVGRNPLAAAKGEGLLAAGDEVILRYITPKMHAAGEIATKKGFMDAVSQHYEGESPDEARIKIVDITDKDERGEPCLRRGCFDLAYRTFATRVKAVFSLLLVPRGAGTDSAVWQIELNAAKGVLDTRMERAIEIAPDPADLTRGTVIDRTAPPSLEGLGARQSLPSLDDTFVPAILPMLPDGRVYHADGDVEFLFGLAGARLNGATVHVKSADGVFLPYAASPSSMGLWCATLPESELLRLDKRLEYYITVGGGLYTARYASPAAPLAVRVIDNAGPALLRAFPAEGQVLENMSRPDMCITVSDVSGLNKERCALFLDGHKVAVTIEENVLRYTPEKALARGAHRWELVLQDTAGNRTAHEATFHIGDGRELYCYRGEVHAHTHDSDGSGSPETAMLYARDVGKVDFFAVTDHSHYLTAADYRHQREVADRFNENGRFAALYGFEMTWDNANGYWGHANVLGVDWIDHPDESDLHAFYAHLTADKNALAMFNHPCDSWGDFDGFAHRTHSLDKRFALSEIKGARFDKSYRLMLANGWHAAPVFNEDNHWGDFTTRTNATGVVLAPSLTRENIMDAMRRHRTYSTEDRTMQILYRANGAWLGSRLHAPERLSVEVKITTQSEAGIGRVELLAEDGITVAVTEAGPLQSLDWRVELAPEFDYYYVKITNGTVYSVTAPIFIEGRDLLEITDMRTAPATGDATRVHAATVRVRNAAEEAMSDVTVDVYLSDEDGFDLERARPFESILLSAMEAGEESAVTVGLPDVPGRRRVTAVVRGHIGKRRFADTRYCLLTPVVITKLMPLTSPCGEIQNPFAFVELCNPTGREVRLDKYELRLWATTGKRPEEGCIFSLKGYTVPPVSVLVVWQRPKGSGLTVADFNARYGTALREGVDIVICEQRILSSRAHARRVDLAEGKSVLCRAAYGGYCGYDKPLVPDEPHLFLKGNGMTAMLQSIGIAPDEEALPGQALYDTLQPAVTIKSEAALSVPLRTAKENEGEREEKGGRARALGNSLGLLNYLNKFQSTFKKFSTLTDEDKKQSAGDRSADRKDDQ